MAPKKSGGTKCATKGKGEDESKSATKEKKGGTAVKVSIIVLFFLIMSVKVRKMACKFGNACILSGIAVTFIPLTVERNMLQLSNSEF
jgi:hypothetical protein